MSNDDNKTDIEESEETRRPSPVIARDVAADPSDLASKKSTTPSPVSPSDATSPVKKLGEQTPSDTPQRGIVLEQGETVQGTSEEDSSTEDAPVIPTPQEEEPEPVPVAHDEDIDAQEDAQEEDVSTFLEEIFPNDDLPSFHVPETPAPEKEDAEQVDVEEIQHEEIPSPDDTVDSYEHGEDGDSEVVEVPSEEQVQPVEIAEESEPVDEEDVSEDEPRVEEEPAELMEEEPVKEEEPVEEIEQDDAEDALESNSDVFESIGDSEPVDDEQEEQAEEVPAPAPVEPVEEVKEPEEVQDVQEEEVDTAEKVETVEKNEDDEFVPTPAVALGKSTSPATPLDTDGLPVSESDVHGILSRVGQLAKTCNMHSLSKEIYQERLPTLEGGRITLVVLGEFNHGKSTVINALLGDQVLPMGITPTTAVITHLVHAEKPVVTIQPPHHGEPYSIAYEEMEKTVKESGEEGEEPEYVEIGYPNEVLKNSLVLVDTPGVNDISRQKVEITYGYLPRADVIVYVLDATQVLKKSEVTFIRDRLLRSSGERIIFVLNKIDALSPDDVEEVVEYAKERLTAILGPVELFTFSGRKALDAQKKGEELPADFVGFKDYLQRFVQEQRAYIILDSALSGGVRVSSLMEQNLAIKRQGYQLEREDLEQRIAAVRARLKESRRLIAENTELIDSRVQGIAATAKHNLRIFTEQFSEQLPMQIERADASDVKRFLPVWIQETFKEWLEKEGSALARSLEELAEEVIQITNESLQKTVQSYQDEFGLTDELDLSVDTVAYDVSVFALGAFGVSIFLFANILVGSLLTLATPVLAYFFKEKIEVRIKERAREQGVKAIETASAKLEEELLRVIHGYGDRLKEFVEMAGDRLYRQIEEALQQVQDETSGDDVDRETLLAHVNKHLEAVHELQGELVKSRNELEAWATSQDFK